MVCYRFPKSLMMYVSHIYIFYNYIYIYIHIYILYSIYCPYISHIQPIYKRYISHLSLGTRWPRLEPSPSTRRVAHRWPRHIASATSEERQRLRRRFRGNPTKIEVGHYFSIVGKLGSDEVGENIDFFKIVMNYFSILMRTRSGFRLEQCSIILVEGYYYTEPDHESVLGYI